jgi:hypothetical protein
MKENLELIIAHRLPGRIRLRLSNSPKQANQLEDHIQSHAGVESIKYTDATRNLLIRFDQSEITHQEIILRAGLSLSMDYDMSPVRIRIQKKNQSLGNLSTLAFAVLAANHTWQLFSSKAGGLGGFQVVTGVATLAAVMEHVVQDFRGKGYFHPEVFSVYYLLLSFIRGNVLKGSTITWFMTFGRHLLEAPANTLLMTPEKTGPNCDIHQCEYEVTVKNEENSNRLLKLIHSIPNMLFKAYKDMNFSLVLEDTFVKQMEDVAESHDDVIEGFGNINQGFYLKMER